MANQTIVSVPPNFNDFKQVRTFAVRLIEQLDIVFGYRGDQGYQVAGSTDELQQVTLSSLNATIQQLTLNTQALQRSIQRTNTIAVSYRTNTAITDTGFIAPTMGAGYSQVQAQEVADGVEAVSTALDEVLAVLRDVRILSS